MRQPKVIATYKADIRITFPSFGTKNKDKRAKKAIEKWLLSALCDNNESIPLYINRAGGSPIEDYAKRVKISIRQC